MPRNTLYVTNFSRESKAADLAPDFEHYGELIRLDIPPPRTDDGEKYAFVEYREVEAAEQALEMHGRQLPYAKEGGLMVQMARSDPYTRTRRSRGRRRDRRGPPDYGRGYDPRGYGYPDEPLAPEAYGPRGYGYAPRGGYNDREHSRDYDRREDYQSYRSKREREAQRRSYSRSPSRDRSRSPVRHRSRSPVRDRSPPARSRSPVRNRSPPPQSSHPPRSPVRDDAPPS
ncbi:hypothetical protein DIURU_005461 [Diutina rugosa]|uniref:RRM domain-containing protein n=1 Tax=Diutina rugosa TaxID=5481 RepID=A0A642UD06_DIURU|nr:uncharacterized protein DIURU_005461 [Diutina rugosa]KAA8896948.1 hypothetical protein DIURU_005461 [Diutina rugosa]